MLLKKPVELNFWNGALLHLNSHGRKHVATIHKNGPSVWLTFVQMGTHQEPLIFCQLGLAFDELMTGGLQNIIQEAWCKILLFRCCYVLFLTFFQIPVSIFRVTYSWLQRMNNCTFSIYQVKSNHWLGNNVFFNYCSAHWNPSKHSTHEPCNVLLKNTRVDRSAASSVETASLTGVLGPFFCFLEGALFTPHHEVYAQGAHAAKTHRRKGKGQGGEFSS